MAHSVLIVDDVAFVRKTLRDIFTEAGYTVVGEAADGADAVQQYAKLRPDIVTMDVVMPPLLRGENRQRELDRFREMHS